MYIFTLKFLAYKKDKYMKKKFPSPPKKITFFYATFQCGRYNVLKKIVFFCPQKVEKIALKNCL
jgi:hypothetical protein